LTPYSFGYIVTKKARFITGQKKTVKEPGMNEKKKAVVFGGFVADALSLGVHWVYNTRVIDKKFGTVDRYFDPLTSYHKGKTAGDFTHYGDQMLVLLESLGKDNRFDANRFAEAWRAFFATYNGYFDKATKTTLANMQAGMPILESGSNSDDLAGASRLVALLALSENETEKLTAAAKKQTAITHKNDQVLLCADYFARCISAVLEGASPLSALESTLENNTAYGAISDLITLGLGSRSNNTREAIAEFGQMCSVEAGLPSAVHLIARYEDDYKKAMVENVMAGGDSSARGILAGSVIAAASGMDAIPTHWISELTSKDRILVHFE
jgi:ADP-ribosylglycohydrolase